MALITCPECGSQISDKASQCPNCGCPSMLFQEKAIEGKRTEVKPNISDNNNYIWGFAYIIVFVMVGFFVWHFSIINTSKHSSSSYTTFESSSYTKQNKTSEYCSKCGKWLPEYDRNGVLCKDCSDKQWQEIQRKQIIKARNTWVDNNKQEAKRRGIQKFSKWDK